MSDKIKDTPVPTILKKRAYRIFKTALNNGTIKRPNRCQICSVKNWICKDGRSYIQGHHEDYNKPLDVKWVCNACHRRITPLASGENNANSKLTYLKVRAIKFLYENKWLMTELAAILNVNVSTISKVINNKQWLTEREKRNERKE